MSETLKSNARREANGDFTKYFSGRGIDIGCGHGPVRPDCDKYDHIFGSADAQTMPGIQDETYDWVYSSHCLEHLDDVKTALAHWWRILKPIGYLIVVVPDFALYEHFHMPSKFNPDHKWFFSIGKTDYLKRLDIVQYFSILPNAQILRVQLNEDGYDYNAKMDYDQPAQREIEVIVRKWPHDGWCR